MIKNAIHQILKDKFGYDRFRPLQEEAITAVLEGHDTLLVLPTGGGKSICFQVPALVKEGISIVVSPLIALMDDQVISLRENGINAYAIHSNVSSHEQNLIYSKISSDSASILYMAPERLLTENMLRYLDTMNVSLIAIDEAHCVSVWGNDFRPEYEKLRILKERFPKVPTIALTATADSATQKDIIEKLALSEPKHLLGSFERKNITISARPGTDRIKEIRKFIYNYEDEAGIIYCLSRKACESVADSLQSFGLEAAYYHAGMTGDERKFVHNNFLYDKIKIVCATIAFGMGIDKSNIRWVIHYNMPKNLEGYYQEIGRSGRDGEPAESLLFSSYADVVKLRSFIDGSEASEQFKIVQSQKLNRMWEFANASNCRTNMILNYFGEFRSEACGHCDNCLNPAEMIDGKVIAQKAMSAIYRSQERLTVRNLIDVLRGSDRSEIKKWGWDRIKTFGAGKDLSPEDWKAYITQLVNMGYIEIDYLNYSKLKLTNLSKGVLFGDDGLSLAKFIWQEKKRTNKKEPVQKITEYDIYLFRELKKVRAEIASSRGVPAYIIFGDASLREMAHYKPKSLVEFSNIKGIGEYKLTEFGSYFVDKIKENDNQ